MNTYSRALRHISMKDVKRKHQQKLVERKILEEKENKIIEELKYKSSPLYSNWRWEISEAMTMTSSGTFETTLPATGDVDLETISGGDQNSFDLNYTDGIEFGSNGNGSGTLGGFNIGGNYLKFSQEPSEFGDRFASTIKVDTSIYTTITVSAIAGNNSNGGISPTTNLSVYWFSDTDSGLLGEIPSNGGSLIDYSFTLPAEARGKSIDIFFYEPDVPEQKSQYIGQSIPSLHPSIWNDNIANIVNSLVSKSNPTDDDFDNTGLFGWIAMQQQVYGGSGASWNFPGYPAPVSGSTSGTTLDDRIAIGRAIYNAFGNGASTRYPLTYGIKNVGFRRLTPVNVFVPLDSPEAVSFIRSDPTFAGLSEAEKKQKLKEMLEASDEYVMKILGENFPGTGSVPPGEFDPFAQPPPGEAGDTPGVEISELPPGGPGKPSETTPIIPPWGGGPVHPGGRPYRPPGGSTPTKYPMA